MARAGIYPIDTRDSLGRERFHHFHIDEFTDRWLVDFIKQNAFYGFKSVGSIQILFKLTLNF
jgi:hypothetical protein